MTRYLCRPVGWSGFIAYREILVGSGSAPEKSGADGVSGWAGGSSGGPGSDGPPGFCDVEVRSSAGFGVGSPTGLVVLRSSTLRPRRVTRAPSSWRDLGSRVSSELGEDQ